MSPGKTALRPGALDMLRGRTTDVRAQVRSLLESAPAEAQAAAVARKILETRLALAEARARVQSKEAYVAALKANAAFAGQATVL